MDGQGFCNSWGVTFNIACKRHGAPETGKTSPPKLSATMRYCWDQKTQIIAPIGGPPKSVPNWCKPQILKVFLQIDIRHGGRPALLQSGWLQRSWMGPAKPERKSSSKVSCLCSGSSEASSQAIQPYYAYCHRKFATCLKSTWHEAAQRESFRTGYPADVPGSSVRTARIKNFGQAVETSEENKHLDADIQEPNARTSMAKRNFGQQNFGLIFGSLELLLLFRF